MGADAAGHASGANGWREGAARQAGSDGTMVTTDKAGRCVLVLVVLVGPMAARLFARQQEGEIRENTENSEAADQRQMDEPAQTHDKPIELIPID